MNSPFPNKKFIIDTNQAPRAIGPYSQAVGFGGLLFVSGQIPVDPKSGEIVGGGVEAQTRQVMNNLQAVLMAAGLDFSHVLKTTVYLRNMNDYDLVNDVYGLYFDYSPPARVTVEVSRLPKDVLVEIDAIAAAPTDYEARATDSEHGAHPGPDDWEEQHKAEAEAVYDQAVTGDADDAKGDADDDEAVAGLDDDDAASEDDAGEESSETADDADGDEAAADEPPKSPSPERQHQSTQELSVDDLQETKTPPPLAPKIKVPKPTKKDD